MILTVRPLDDATWPGPFTPPEDREPCRFSASWRTVLRDLGTEVDMAGSPGSWRTFHTPAVLEVPFPETRIYRDGTGVHADARAPRHPGVALSFEVEGVGPIRLASDRYRGGGGRYLPDWQANVRAISLTLEALRTVERHGATRSGQQYRGWNALGAGTPEATPLGRGLSRIEAAEIVAGLTGYSVEEVLAAPSTACRQALRRTHPDSATGDRAALEQVQAARDVLQ